MEAAAWNWSPVSYGASVAEMEVPLVSPTLPLYLAEILFGLLYAALIHWLGIKGYLKGQTAWSVVVGDGATLFIQWLFFRESWNPFVTVGSFACSGTPMIVTYLYRHQLLIEKAKHTRRPWPTAALKARDDAVMDLSKTIRDIEEAAKNNCVTAGMLLEVSNRLHEMKRTLTSV